MHHPMCVRSHIRKIIPRVFAQDKSGTIQISDRLLLRSRVRVRQFPLLPGDKCRRRHHRHNFTAGGNFCATAGYRHVYRSYIGRSLQGPFLTVQLLFANLSMEQFQSLLDGLLQPLGLWPGLI